MEQYKLIKNSQFTKVIKRIIDNCNEEESLNWMKYLSSAGDRNFRITILSYWRNDRKYDNALEELTVKNSVGSMKLKEIKVLLKNHFSMIIEKIINECTNKEIKNWLNAISGMGDKKFNEIVVSYWKDNNKYNEALDYYGYIKKESIKKDDNKQKIEYSKTIEKSNSFKETDIKNVVDLMLIVGKYEIDSKIGQEGNEYHLVQTSNFEITKEDADDLKTIEVYKEQLLNSFEGKEIWKIRRNGEVIWEKPKEQKSDIRTLIVDRQCIRNYTNGGVHKYYTEDGKVYY